MLITKGMRFPIDVSLVCIRWYAAYLLSYRHLKEMMQERGVAVYHSSVSRWAIRFLPCLVPGTVAIDKSGSTGQRSSSQMHDEKTRSRFGKSNTSTTSWNRITALSNESPDQCSASNRFEPRKLFWPALN